MYPSVETWFVSNDVEREALSNPLTVTFDEGRIEVGPLELQIAYELRLARTADSPSGKDFEDALHLYLTFEERFDTEQLEAYVNQLGVEEYYGNLPRPTRSLLPCGGRSLLEGGAFPRRNCTPRPRVVRESDALSSSAHGRRSRPFAWSAGLDESRAYHERREASFERHGPGFLLRFHGGGGASEQCCDPRLPDPCRGLSRRFNRRWTARASPTTGCEAGRPRTADAGSLAASTDPDVCGDGSNPRDGPRGENQVATR